MSPGRLGYYLLSIPTLMLGVRNWPTAVTRLLRRPPRPPFEVRLRNGCRFKVATALDVWILKEVCLDREYECGGPRIQAGWTIVDIGAGVGEFCVSVAREHPTCRVYAFEPLASSFALLQDNVRLNGLSNVTLVPSAVSAHAGGAFLHTRGASARSSILATGARRDPAGHVRSTTLESAFRALGIAHVDFLKLDCEGAEYEILFGTEAATLGRLSHIALEYHDGVTASSGAELADFLVARGFSVRLVPSRAYPDRLGLLYATNRQRASPPALP